MITLTNIEDLYDLIDAAIREGYPLSYEVKQDIASFFFETKYGKLGVKNGNV
jgi:hypothetical protein